MKITNSSFDPVFVEESASKGKIEIRIGEKEPGKSRYATLGPKEARLLAFALLTQVELASE